MTLLPLTISEVIWRLARCAQLPLPPPREGTLVEVIVPGGTYLPVVEVIRRPETGTIVIVAGTVADYPTATEGFKRK
jgi:hypothetical protein